MKCRKNETEFHGRCVPKNKPFVGKIVVMHIAEESPDLSDLGKYSNEPGEFAIENPQGDSRHYLYFNAENVSNMEEAQQNFERMERYEQGDWGMMGIVAEAELMIPHKSIHPTWQIQRISSGGLWGIESDSGESYLKEVEQEELANLKSNLKELGVSEREFKRAKLMRKKFHEREEEY